MSLKARPLYLKIDCRRAKNSYLKVFYNLMDLRSDKSLNFKRMRCSKLFHEAVTELKGLIDKLQPKTVIALFSGGKDSLVSTYIATVCNPSNFEVVHINTTCALPGVSEYVVKVCEHYKWPKKILKPDPDFWTLVKRWGAPSPKRRWCCHALKLKPIRQYISAKPKPVLLVMGLRAKESMHRLKLARNGLLKQTYWDKKASAWVHNPIFLWTNEDVNTFIRWKNLIVNPLYEVLDNSGECFCGTFKTVREIRLVRTLFPEFFSKFIEIEREFRKGGSMFYIQNKRVYARDIQPMFSVCEANASAYK